MTGARDLQRAAWRPSAAGARGLPMGSSGGCGLPVASLQRRQSHAFQRPMPKATLSAGFTRMSCTFIRVPCHQNCTFSNGGSPGGCAVGRLGARPAASNSGLAGGRGQQQRGHQRQHGDTGYQGHFGLFSLDLTPLTPLHRTGATEAFDLKKTGETSKV